MQSYLIQNDLVPLLLIVCSVSLSIFKAPSKDRPCLHYSVTEDLLSSVKSGELYIYADNIAVHCIGENRLIRQLLTVPGRTHAA